MDIIPFGKRMFTQLNIMCDIPTYNLFTYVYFIVCCRDKVLYMFEYYMPYTLHMKYIQIDLELDQRLICICCVNKYR